VVYGISERWCTEFPNIYNKNPRRTQKESKKGFFLREKTGTNGF